MRKDQEWQTELKNKAIFDLERLVKKNFSYGPYHLRTWNQLMFTRPNYSATSSHAPMLPSLFPGTTAWCSADLILMPNVI